ncbi:Cupredoxin [Delitschia confertaspora ATCC 74209]|uniref:Cupredoxin n=1 Tax=Delitschia confertaspora ATCC 74209 TaxID=1513339 RepID=A0A9P4JQM8_9PLEO|nr:Cupredoxin [Delitschia confertaspora ATCC 74209]
MVRLPNIFCCLYDFCLLITPGIEQLNTPWADGVPGLTQHAIQPGDNYTYEWKATQYGSYFYHAHSRDQVDDGLVGAMVIKPRHDLPRPFDKISDDPNDFQLMKEAENNVTPLILADWRHLTSDESWDLQVKAGVETSGCVDSILINGKGAVYCWDRYEIDYFTKSWIKPLLEENNWAMTDKGCVPPDILHILLDKDSKMETHIEVIPEEMYATCEPTKGTGGSVEIILAKPEKKWLAFDVISAAGIEYFAFSIDQHPMWVYAVDGHYIEPMLVQALEVSNGERYSVFIKLDQPAANYGIRVASIGLTQLIDTTAILAYEGGEEDISNPYTDQAGGKTSDDVTFFDTKAMLSYPPQFPSPPPEVDQTFILQLGITGATYLWALNNTGFDANIDRESTPWLDQDPEHLSDDSLVIKTKNNTWVDIIFQTTSPNQPPHPIHKHANKWFLIGEGEGDFTWNSVQEAMEEIPDKFNLDNPPYRDGFQTLTSSTNNTWSVVRYHVVNPGAWMIHCHIQSHLLGGMAAIILDGVDTWPQPQEE